MKHTSLLLLRLLFSYVVLRAMAFAHVRFGSQYPGDGQQAFGVVVLFVLIGEVAAVIYFALGSVLHFLMRRRSGSSIFLVDALLCALFAGALAFAGATASYNETSPPPAVKRTTLTRSPASSRVPLR